MSDRQYRHVLKAVFEKPWAITRPVFETILDLVELRASGGALSDDEIQERLALAAATNGPRQGRRNGLVAVLPMYGVISPRQNLMSQTSGGTTLDSLSAAFDQVLADPEVAAIVFDVDSPGGAISGVEEFANKVRAARGQKPIVAVADHTMASAAYWISSSTDEIVVSPTAHIGSVGVIGAHQDMSGAYEQEGIVTTLITSSKFKAEGNEFEPLSDSARAEMQKHVDYFGAMFEATVAKGRGVPIDKVRSDFGQGRILTPKDAVAVGMADRIDTLEATISRLARGGALKIQPNEPDPSLLDASDLSSPTVVATYLTKDNDEDTLPAGVPFATHAERVLLDVTALARRAGEIQALRAEDGRDLSEAKRGQLTAIADQLADAHGSLIALLAPPEPPANDDAPAAAAAARRRRLALAEAAMAGNRLN